MANAITVYFEVADDADASRIAAIHRALGHEPIRRGLTGPRRLAWIASELSRIYHLGSIVDRVLEVLLELPHLAVDEARNYHEIGRQASVSAPSAKWACHVIEASIAIGSSPTRSLRDVIRHGLAMAPDAALKVAS